MKKSLFLMMLFALSMISLSSCSKDEDKFDYPMETIYGTWNGTDVLIDGKWRDITNYPYTQFAFSIKFNSDGSYYGSGYFGNGSGTYKAEGNTITTYIDGKEYARYIVKTLSNNKAELTMFMGDDSMDIKVEKK